jgi:hypothetical protein
MKNKNELESFLMKLFFSYAWKKRPKTCECGCGTLLPKEINTAVMDHTLEKSVYPECKYSISNIRFYNPDCHTRKTNGFPNKKQEEYIDWALKNYHILIKESDNFVERVMKKLDNGIFDKK